MAGAPPRPDRAVPYSALVLGAAWLALILCGMWVLAEYGSTPGERGDSPAHLGSGEALQADGERFVLTMFAHPRCACSRASVRELARLMARVGGRVSASVVFYEPADADAAWRDTDLWSSAAAIPGVTVRADVEGRLAEDFGARTSGHVVLYAPDGALRYSGGITAARGHEGDSAGRAAILAVVERGDAPLSDSEVVFGCSLRTPEPRGDAS